MGQVKRTGQRGLVLALIGLVLGYLSLLASIFVVALLASGLVASSVKFASDYTTSSGPSGSANYSQSVDSSELRIGDCFNSDALDGSSDPAVSGG